MNEDALQKQYEAIQLESARTYRGILKQIKVILDSGTPSDARLAEAHLIRMQVLKTAAEIIVMGVSE